jgi:two-component system response regulator NreC
MRRKASVVIVEGSPAFRQALASELNDLGAQVVGCANNLADGLSQVKSAKPDLIVLDRNAVDGDVLEVVHAVRDVSPKTRAAVLFATFEALEMCRVCRAGICGCLVKMEATADLRAGLRRVLAYGKVRSAGIRRRTPTVGLKDRARARRTYGLALLTKRELQVLPYIARGFSLEETAEIMRLSPKTIDLHKTHLMTKLGIHERASLTRFAIREGLISM